MSESQSYREQISLMSQALESAASDLSDAQLATRPQPSLNPPGFIIWHALRVWDVDLNVRILGNSLDADGWQSGGFTDELGYDPRGHGGNLFGNGFGFTDAEVEEIPYRREALMRYHAQLLEKTEGYLAELDDADLRARIPFEGAPGVAYTGADRLQHTISHSWNHIGELRVIKSLLGFVDPTKPPALAR